MSTTASEQLSSLLPWPKRTSSLPLRDITPTGKGRVAMKSEYVTIALSGCSSSGKSTLALLLQEIFSSTSAPRTRTNPSIEISQSLSDLSVATSNKENVDPKVQESIADPGRGIVIHQDAFFLDKSHCPTVTYRSTFTDLAFIEKTLLNDKVGTYILSWEGGRIVRNAASNAALVKPTSLDWLVTGADTDCWQSLDIPTMVSCIKEIRETGSTTCLSERYRREDAKLPGLLMSAAERDTILLKSVDLVSEMKETFKCWVKDQAVSNAEARFGGLNIQGAIETGTGKEALRPKFVIIEGFLLFPDPLLHGPFDESSSNSDEENQLASPQNDLADLPGIPEDVNEHEAYVADYEAINASSRQKLMENFDIKLFLPTSMKQAKTRRLRRPLYIDAPNGNRLPGQMWKTDGYFNDIVWGNHVKECSWLVERNRVETSAAAARAGVHVRPGIDMGLEDTVRWAVDVILGELGSKVRNPNSAVQCEHENQEMDYEDDEGKLAANDEQMVGKRSKKKNAVREKLAAMKLRFTEFIESNKKPMRRVIPTNEPTITRKRDSLSSLFGKRRKSAKFEADEKQEDVGLKTILGSALQNIGFFSPKQEYRGPGA